MKIKILSILFTVLFIGLNGYSQRDSLSTVDKKEIKNFHKQIFKLQVDSIIDSNNVYKLVYISNKGWVADGTTQYKNVIKSGDFKSFANSKTSILDLFKKHETITKVDTTQTYLTISSHPNISANSSLSPIFENYIIHSNNDAYYKDLKNKSFDIPILEVAISLGGKYVLIVKKIEYIGNNSFSSVKYSYYEKMK